MTDNLVTLADERAKKEKERLEQKAREREDKKKKLVPLSALIVANIIFLSLDIRAFQAIFTLTQSNLLAILTVMISGGLAMYWFDVLYPHSQKHKNETQRNISIICTVLAIGLSGVLAFADYVVGTGDSYSYGWSNTLWASIVILTIVQGVSIAWWWAIDNHIAAEAKIQEAHAEASDQADEMSILRTKLQGLRGVLTELNSLNTDFSPEAVSTVARIMGIALPTDKPIKPTAPMAPTNPMRSYASDAEKTDFP